LSRILAAWAIIACAAGAYGCDVVRLQRGRLEGRFDEAGLEARTERIGDATVAYREGGRGPAVLLLHGFGAPAIWQWAGQVGALARGHRVIVPDLLWFGGSSSDVADLSLDHQVRIVLALLDRLGVARAHVVGISYGGLVAYELAAAHPDRVEKVVIVDSPGRAYERADYDSLCRRMGVAKVSDLLVPKDAAGVRRLLEIAYDDPPNLPEWVLEQTLEELYSEHLEEKAALLDVVVDHLEELTAGPDGMRAQTLVVWGREDPVFPLEIGQRLVKRLAGRARLEIIEDARHAPPVEHPDEFNRILLGFLGD
jgi:pimeloyl-ACP methyl ester carboxylesterase